MKNEPTLQVSWSSGSSSMPLLRRRSSTTSRTSRDGAHGAGLDPEPARQLQVPHRRRVGRRRQGERHVQHDVAVGVLERARPEPETAPLRRPVLHRAGDPVVHGQPADRVGDLAAVGADVLHGRRAGASRDPGHRGQARPAVRDAWRRRPRPTPRRPGPSTFDSRAPNRRLQAGRPDEHDDARPALVGDDEVAAAAHEQHGLARGVGRAHGLDELVGRGGDDDPRGRAAEPQRGQVGEQVRHGSRRYRESLVRRPACRPPRRAEPRLAAGRARALGLPTRGTTNPNRLRRMDNWITARPRRRSCGLRPTRS